MCHVARFPPPQLLKSPTKVLEDLAVDEFDFTRRGKSDDQPRNAVHQQARLAFALAKSIFGALLVVDVNNHAVPFRDPTIRITHSLSDGPNPAILTIGPSQSVDILVTSSRGDRMQPASHRSLAVIGIDEFEPSAVGEALRRVPEMVHGALIQVVQVAFCVYRARPGSEPRRREDETGARSYGARLPRASDRRCRSAARTSD